MATIKNVNDATPQQSMRDLLKQMLTVNLSKKNVGSVTASDTGLRISTAGDYSINGTLYNKAASSAAFALAGANVPAGSECHFLLSLGTDGSGTVTQGDNAAIGSSVLPDVPAAKCPIAKLKVITGTASFVPGTTTFSQVLSAGGGSVVVTDIMGVNTES